MAIFMMRSLLFLTTLSAAVFVWPLNVASNSCVSMRACKSVFIYLLISCAISRAIAIEMCHNS